MAELDERVAHLETGMEDQKQLNADLRADFKDLRVEMRSEFGNVRAEIHAVRSEMALRTETAALYADIRDLRSTMDRHFLWLVGVMLTGFLALFGAILRVIDRLP